MGTPSTDVLAEQITNLVNTMNRIESALITHMLHEEKQLETILKSLDDKYAAKWVEKIMVFAGSVTGSIIIGAFMYVIIKK